MIMKREIKIIINLAGRHCAYIIRLIPNSSGFAVRFLQMLNLNFVKTIRSIE